jgi:WXG100 family type VII secretion target
MVTLSPLGIREAADEFESASKESQALVGKLEKVAGGLKGSWSGPTQEAFYRHFEEWQRLMRLQVALLTTISAQLRELAERYAKADRFDDLER